MSHSRFLATLERVNNRAICLLASSLALPSLAQAQQAAPAAPAAEVVKEVRQEPLKLFADLRIRLEIDTRDQDGADDEFDDSRTRPRLRARFGLSYETPVEGVSFGMRVATNAGTPGNSPHESFALDQENVFELDRAFIEYQPHDGVTLVAGKQGWPHWQQTEIFWDEDIQPEGFAASYVYDLGDGGSIGVNAAYFYLVNNSWEEQLGLNDVFGTWQLRWQGKLGDLAPTVAITGGHLQDHGETSNADTVAVGDATFFMGSAQVKSKLGDDLELTVGVDVVTSDVDKDDFAAACVDPCENWDETLGFVGQLRVGYDKWGARYYYYSIGEASVPFYAPLGSLTQDNFPSNSASLTGFTGHRIQFDRNIGDGVSADLRIYIQSGNDNNVLSFAEPATRSTNRYQLNINAKF